jgi:hypothetical protein
MVPWTGTRWNRADSPIPGLYLEKLACTWKRRTERLSTPTSSRRVANFYQRLRDSTNRPAPGPAGVNPAWVTMVTQATGPNAGDPWRQRRAGFPARGKRLEGRDRLGLL